MMLNIESDELDQWKQTRKFLESYLGRNVGSEIIPTVILEALEKLTSDLLEKTKQSQCNCINFDTHEMLEKEEQELITLRKLMGWEVW